MAKPKIRFKGYTDDWEQRKFSEGVSEIGDGLHGTPIYCEDGNVYFINGNNLVDGKIVISAETKKVNESQQSTADKSLDDTTILMSINGTIGNLAYYSGERLMLGKSAAYIKVSEFDKRFVYAYLQAPSVQGYFMDSLTGTTIKNLGLKAIREMIMFIPQDVDEQKRIGKFFDYLDHLITLHQRKCEETKKLKKYMLQKMFPQNGQTVPEIRFVGFTDAWEQRKLGELYSILTERNTDLLPYNITLSVATMTYKTDGNGAADSSLANYKRLRIGDIAFEGHTSKEFRYGRFVLNDAGDGIMSPRFSALRPYTQMPTTFWKYYIHYEPIMRKVLVNSTKAGTMMNELVVDEFLKSSLYVPSKEEQACIGGYFTTLDHLITLHQHKCEELQNMKKFMLQNMFV